MGFCQCSSCQEMRDRGVEGVTWGPGESRTYSAPLGNGMFIDYSQPVAVPFEPEYIPFGPRATPVFEPEQPAEPVYKFVLVDYGDDNTPLEWAAELHTSESLIEALILRKDQAERYRVFELGECFLDVSE